MSHPRKNLQSIAAALRARSAAELQRLGRPHLQALADSTRRFLCWIGKYRERRAQALAELKHELEKKR